MKAIKTIGIVVGVVALAATGVGLALGGAAAASAATAAGLAVPTFAGMSAATFATIATAATLTAGAISVGTGLFAPKPGFSNQGNPLNFQTNPQSGLPYCIGRTRMSGVRIHADTYDGLSYKSEGKQDVLSFAVLLSAGGAVEGPLTFRADKETISFNGTTGMASGGYADWMAQKVSLGVAGASALALAFGGGNFPGWSSAHKLSGITHALWDLRFDPKGNKYGAGVPAPEWTGKWVKVYDPRKDSTYPGGSGSHRALNEATYEWSANPALHALTWALGRWQNGKRTLGIGAPVANIRVSDFVEAANVADANEWKCGGVEWSTDSKWSVLKRMLQAGGAEPTMTGAMIGCRVNTPRVSVATVTADKLLDSASFPMTRSRRDRFNTVIPRYRSEDHDWEVISGAPIQVTDYVTADGSPRTKEIDFPLVQHETGGNGNQQAGQLAAYEIVNSREAGPWRFTVGPEYVGVKTGDVITLDVPDEGIAEQPVLVRSRSIDPATFKITFEVETETTAKHDFALGKTAIPPPTYSPTPPDLTPPTPSDALWSLGAESVGGIVPALRVVGACEFPGADQVLIEYRVDGAADWQSAGSFDAGSPVDHLIAPVEGDTDYEARLAYKSGNRLGGWLVLDVVTTPAVELGSQIHTQISPEAIVLEANDAGVVTSYASAVSQFKVRLSDGTDVSSNFTLATASGGNPAGLIVSYSGQTITISGGFDEETMATLTVVATGSGAYSGIVLTRVLVLAKNTVNEQIDAMLEPSPDRWVSADADGDVINWTPAQFEFVARLKDGTDISSHFTLDVATGGNPDGMSGDITDQTIVLDGGLTFAESPGTLVLEATGSGDYAGVVIRRILRVHVDRSGVVLTDLLSANDRNTGVPPGTGAISAVTKQTAADGRVSYTATVTYNYDADAQAASNVDGFAVGYYMASTNAAHTMVGVEGNSTAAEWNGEVWRQHFISFHPGISTYKLQFFEDVDPTKWITIGVMPTRVVDRNVDPDGIIFGPIAQYGPFQPGSVQAITGSAVTIGGQSATNVGTGAGRANAAIDSNNAIATGTKIGGSGGQTAANVSDGTTRALGAIVSGTNKIAGNAVITDSVTTGAVSNVITATSATAIQLGNYSWTTLWTISVPITEPASAIIFKMTQGVENTNTSAGAGPVRSEFRLRGADTGVFPTSQAMELGVQTLAGQQLDSPITYSWVYTGPFPVGTQIIYFEGRNVSSPATLESWVNWKTAEIIVMKKV